MSTDYLPTSATWIVGRTCFRITREWVNDSQFEGHWQFTCYRNVSGLPLIGFYRSTGEALDAAADYLDREEIAQKVHTRARNAGRCYCSNCRPDLHDGKDN